ncbi:hypothetical protein SADUNF_Sadunf03G0087900 [Salix dunnii]|uniref:Integrase catalytic domain-containing protein n=1 Tax=Salix dunnii TaxID=1413687 RepID=A0A835KAP7_9ROSI|nr:hypothetical protein SADUNF_Sadunf03G0087900 [Salix dunnii]
MKIDLEQRLLLGKATWSVAATSFSALKWCHLIPIPTNKKKLLQIPVAIEKNRVPAHESVLQLSCKDHNHAVKSPLLDIPCFARPSAMWFASRKYERITRPIAPPIPSGPGLPRKEPRSKRDLRSEGFEDHQTLMAREREAKKGAVYWDLRQKTFCTNSEISQNILIFQGDVQPSFIHHSANSQMRNIEGEIFINWRGETWKVDVCFRQIWYQELVSLMASSSSVSTLSCTTLVDEAYEEPPQTGFVGSQNAISIKLQNLWREFENLTMKDNEFVKDFSSITTEIINQIKSCGDNVSDKRIAEKILRRLPKKYEHIVAIIEEIKDLSRLAIHKLLKETRFEQDQRGGRSFFRKETYERASESRNRNRGRGRGTIDFQQRGGSNNFYCIIWKRIGHEPRDYSFKCTRCENPSHSEKKCWHKEKADGSGEINAANFSKDEDQLFYSYMSIEHKGEEVWRVEIKGRGDVSIHSNEGSFAFLLFITKLESVKAVCQMKTPRTDHGGEFISKPFLDSCKDNGIQRHLPVRCTPQHNGLGNGKKLSNRISKTVELFIASKPPDVPISFSENGTGSNSQNEGIEPQNFEEAVRKEERRKAMNKEMIASERIRHGS